MNSTSTSSYRKKTLWVSIGIGAFLGITSRLAFGAEFWWQYVPFFALFPMVLGLIAFLLKNPSDHSRWTLVIFIPWISMLGLFVLFGALSLEKLMLLLFGLAFLLVPVTLLVFLIGLLIRISRDSKQRS